MTGALSTTTRKDLSDLVNRADLRKRFAFGYSGGAGAINKIKDIQLCLEVRYNFYPGNVNKDGTRYSDPVNVFKYYYIDDDFRVGNIQLNVGITYIISYNNQKVK